MSCYAGKRVLVTAGAAFLVSHLVTRCLQAGAYVRIVCRRELLAVHPRLEVWRNDWRGAEACLKAAQTMDAVNTCQKRWTSSGNARYLPIRCLVMAD
jgi:uncharacterized protein YbjT (DUF2867 family)